MYKGNNENKTIIEKSFDNVSGAVELLALPADSIVERVALKIVDPFVGYAAINASAITIGTEVITSAAHGLINGLAVQVTSSDTLPTGISALTDYYVINVSANEFKIAESLEDAAAGTAFNFTDVGVGTITFTPTPLVVEVGDNDDENGFITDLASASAGLYPLSDIGTYAGAYCLTDQAVVGEKLYTSANAVNLNITGVAKSGSVVVYVEFEVF